MRIGRDPTDLRSDTIMILRTDPASGRAALLSLPRDLYVTLADGMGQGRINLAIQRGGAPLLIRTIAENFGIEINHYVQVDFASFRGLVEAIDGVPVPIPYPARDEETGLDLPEAGCHTLDPVQALAYVRSRHYEEQIDGRWVEDLRSDIGRIARQQDFIRRALSRAIDRGARNPGTLDQLIDVGLSGITVDSELTADDIVRPRHPLPLVRPREPHHLLARGHARHGGRGGRSSGWSRGPQTDAVLSLFRGGTGELAPQSVQVTVRNGTGAPRQGAEATAALAGVGFVATVAGDELGAGADGTVVRYPAGQEAAADLVARWLAGGARLEEVAAGSGIEVVTGTDWQGVRTEASPSTSTTTQTTLPEGTTTTSAPGVVVERADHDHPSTWPPWTAEPWPRRSTACPPDPTTRSLRPAAPGRSPASVVAQPSDRVHPRARRDARRRRRPRHRLPPRLLGGGGRVHRRRGVLRPVGVAGVRAADERAAAHRGHRPRRGSGCAGRVVCCPRWSS